MLFHDSVCLMMHDFQSVCQINAIASISMCINSIKRIETQKITEFKEMNKCCGIFSTGYNNGKFTIADCRFTILVHRNSLNNAHINSIQLFLLLLNILCKQRHSAF